MFNLNITIQSQEHNGCKLLVKGLVTRDFWLDFSGHKGEVDMSAYPTITPKHIEHFIKLALGQGWSFSSKGKDFVLAINDGDVNDL